ncbi:DUF2269 family protein [Paenibacillus sedimenti]|uniref:DUF2269 family protein n=1 Tax=Paenibacillus sedimenti TaxID=2770274 RepID=A0A926QHH6_9BACL|nr:DUF2269 family protein [Paenibacillus sedimenti]MBD0379510.1 DUF2269 family protein [Paenibacillus sedimenti]
MKWLVLIHIMSSIIGIGPTYFGHILFRKRQQVGELRRSLELFQILNFFPKIGGTIAVLSGLLLVWLGGWSFVTFWIIASLILYIAIQVVAVGLLGPITAKLQKELNSPKLSTEQEIPRESILLLAKANGLYYTASALGVILFILMIIKP